MRVTSSDIYKYLWLLWFLISQNQGLNIAQTKQPAAYN